jgi:hypothetical protein
MTDALDRFGSTRARLLIGGVILFACGKGPTEPSLVSVTPASATLFSVGETLQLSATLHNVSGDTVVGWVVRWSSSDEAVVTVDRSGMVTAVADGRATITAASDGASGTAQVIVQQRVATVSVSSPTDTLRLFGETAPLEAAAHDALGNAVHGVVFTWASSDEAVVRVDASGLVTTGITGMGTAAITAASDTVTGSVDVSVSFLRWAVADSFYGFAEAPAVATDGTLYVAAKGALFAFDPDGTVRWTHEGLGYPSSSPTVGVDGTVYVNVEGDSLVAVWPDGTRRWGIAIPGSHRSEPALAADGTVFLHSNDGGLYAINLDGSLKWSYPTGGAPEYSGPAVAADGTIYVPSKDDTLHAVHPDGTRRWATFIDGLGFMYWGPPTITADGSIYVGVVSGLHALYPDGTERWSRDISWMSEWGPVIAVDGTLYLTFHGAASPCCDFVRVHAVAPDGAINWTYEGQDARQLWSTPAVTADGVLYYATAGGRGSGDVGGELYALNPDGMLRWVYPLEVGAGDRSSVAVGEDGTVYVSACQGGAPVCRVYAIRGETSGLAPSPWPRFKHDNRGTANVSPP